MVLVLVPVAICRGDKVLGVFPFPSRSHMIVQKSLMFELARRGHEVTVVSAFPENKVIPNYTDIEVKTRFNIGKRLCGVYSSSNGGMRKA